jgi:hypothetical protein
MLKHLTLVKVENNNCKDVQISLFIYFLTKIGTLMIKFGQIWEESWNGGIAKLTTGIEEETKALIRRGAPTSTRIGACSASVASTLYKRERGSH